MRRTASSFIGLLGLASAGFLSAAPAGASGVPSYSTAPTVHAAASPPVQIGVDNAAPPGKNWEYVHYFPEKDVSVAQGGVVLFNWNQGSLNGLHSVTLIPSGMTEAQVRSVYPIATADTDGGEHDVVQPAINNNPTDFGCSTPANHTPCVFDGTKVVSSGAIPTSSGAVFGVQLSSSLPTGNYTYVCLIHHNMRGTFQVVGAAQPATDPGTIASAAKADLDLLNNEASAAEAAAQRPVYRTNPDGTRTWNVKVGLTADDVELLQMLPTYVPIRKGDTVHYDTSPTQNEIHTVSFNPFSSANGPPAGVPFGPFECESAIGPDVVANNQNAGPPETACADPSTFEQPFILPPQGEANTITSGRTVGSSGLLTTVPEFVANGARAAHDYNFPNNGSFVYVCLVHRNMGGVIATPGYRVATSDGGLFAFGAADFLGSKGASTLRSPVVATVSTADSQGYWLVTRDGHTYNFGDAPDLGSVGVPLAFPIVAATETTGAPGLLLAGSDGGVFTLGGASYSGSMGGAHLNAPIVSITADQNGGPGYTLIAADGGTFNFGEPQIGSLGGLPLAAPIVAAFRTITSQGLTLVASDGGVFNLGDSPFWGSLGGTPIDAPIVGVAPVAGTFGGYRLLSSNGGVFDFGPDASFLGSLARGNQAPAIGIIGA